MQCFQFKCFDKGFFTISDITWIKYVFVCEARGRECLQWDVPLLPYPYVLHPLSSLSPVLNMPCRARKKSSRTRPRHTVCFLTKNKERYTIEPLVFGRWILRARGELGMVTSGSASRIIRESKFRAALFRVSTFRASNVRMSGYCA